MAIIDESKGVLVVRIVYDGPAMSGKTTSLRSLARGVSSRVECPDELGGRTLFFDWVDYVGGLFEGRQIRCQIVSVPGQRALSHRRRLLLETADAVVLVLDTRQDEWESALGWVRETVPYCRVKDPPVGLVLQANKRDALDAVTREAMRDSLNRIAPVAVVPSTATTGDGIREAFVLAVRLALDRVRVLSATGRLPVGKPSEDHAQELLERMRAAEKEGAQRANDTFARSVASSLDTELAPWEPMQGGPAPDVEPMDERMFVPDPMMPGGMIWPPVDGRALLHEVASLSIRPARTGRADWCGSGSGFRFHSFGQALFADLPSARNDLIEWARQHAANAAHLSNGRAVILADAGRGRLRLWQIVRADDTLRERLAAAVGLAEPRQVASEVLSVAVRLALARESFAEATVDLPCTLWTVAAGSASASCEPSARSRPAFVGLMPYRGSVPAPEIAGRALLERELVPHLREMRRSRVDYDDVGAELLSLAALVGSPTPAQWLAQIVLQI
jgi:signal recognition particle receptor subunit beta